MRNVFRERQGPLYDEHVYFSSPNAGLTRGRITGDLNQAELTDDQGATVAKGKIELIATDDTGCRTGTTIFKSSNPDLTVVIGEMRLSANRSG